MESNVIKLESLSKSYDNFEAVKAVSLNVRKGDIYGLIGKNGAGKTTLFKLILGLSKPTSGSISINESTSYESLLKERNNIGFLIGSNFFSYLNAYQNIEYFRKLKGISDKSETERVLKIVGLDGVDKPFKAYSMGMKQRLGIANAILGNPEIVILDEPVNGLDPQGIVDIRNLIKKLSTEFGMTLIVSSHILSELDLVATRFGIIDQGVLIKEVDREHLQDSNIVTLVLKTSDLEKTNKILLENFEECNTVLKDDKLEITSSEIDSSQIIYLLVQENILVREVYFQQKSLEDIYFNLTGGGSSHD